MLFRSDGFKPINMEDWDKGRFLAGCQRKEVLRECEGFLSSFPVTKWPDGFALVGGDRSTHDGCADECFRNCSCVAFAYANLGSDRSSVNVSRCLVWTAELVDTGMLDSSWPYEYDTLYLMLAGMRQVAKFL